MGRLGGGQVGDRVVLVRLEGVGVDFDALDRERAGGRAVVERHFQAMEPDPAECPGHPGMDGDGNRDGAEKPALLDAVNVGANSK